MRGKTIKSQKSLCGSTSNSNSLHQEVDGKHTNESCSSDDNSHYDDEDNEYNDVNQHHRHQQQNDDYFDEDYCHNSDGDKYIGPNQREKNNSVAVSKFEDLPTDDSEEESDDFSSEDSSDDHNDDYEGSKELNNHRHDSNEDIPISERVIDLARLGRRYYTGKNQNDELKYNRMNRGEDNDGGKRDRAERKNLAVEVASERLRKVKNAQDKSEMRKKRSDQSTSDDDSCIEQSSLNHIHSNINPDTNKSNLETKRKKSKHAPTEMSSKRKDHYARKKPDLNSSGVGVCIGSNRYKARDPRMVSLSGHSDAGLFEKRYGFLDEIQEKEIQSLKRRVDAWKTTGKKGQKQRKKLGLTHGGGSLEEDQEQLKKLLQERAERKRAAVTRAAKQSVKKKIREDVASGKRGAYYPKRDELRKMEMEARFDEIRKRGGDEAVDMAIAKRRKKNIAKSHKLMPSHLSS